MLKGKHILIGVTGSIAAYKAAILVRLLVKEGAEVKVIMTPLAKEFITPLTLATLSKNPILVDFFNPENGDWNSHVDLGLWADAYVIAPATANTLAKMAHGIADNLLLTTYFSSRSPVVVAPAMDLDMFLHPSTQQNLETLRGFGNHIVEPSTGELASGLEGKGRMEEPEIIVVHLKKLFEKKKSEPSKLAGRRILITAGPTLEAIDPVRYISNHSSGKMAYALAQEAAKKGAEVVLISGPVNRKAENKSIRVVNVQSAKEMYEAAIREFTHCQVAIMAAAVADFTPEVYQQNKIKDKGLSEIRLVPTKDIAQELGTRKTNKQLLVGFALETNNELENAKIKLISKNLDLIVLNSLQDKNAGFQHDTNKITLIGKDNKEKDFELKTKELVALDILDAIEELL